MNSNLASNSLSYRIDLHKTELSEDDISGIGPVFSKDNKVVAPF